MALGKRCTGCIPQCMMHCVHNLNLSNIEALL